MKESIAVILAMIMMIQIDAIAVSQDSCMPKSNPVNDIEITFNFPNCHFYPEPNHSKIGGTYSLKYKNDTNELDITIMRNLCSQEYRFNYTVMKLLNNQNPSEPSYIGIDDSTGMMIVGSPNNQSEKKRIVLGYCPKELESGEYVCTIATTMDEISFQTIRESFKIKKALNSITILSAED